MLLDGDRAVGAATSAGEIHADTVVVAAGAYGSPGILLRSGIGPELGLPVGEGLLDHVGVGVGWEPTERALRGDRRFADERAVCDGAGDDRDAEQPLRGGPLGPVRLPGRRARGGAPRSAPRYSR